MAISSDMIDFSVSDSWAHFYAHRGLMPHYDWMDAPTEKELLYQRDWEKSQAELRAETHEWNLRLGWVEPKTPEEEAVVAEWQSTTTSPSSRRDIISGSSKQVEWAEDIFLQRHEQAATEAEIQGLQRLLSEHREATWWIETRGVLLETLLYRGKVSVSDF